MSRIQLSLDNRLTDGGKVVSLTRRSHSPETFSGTHFCQRVSKGQGLVLPEGLGKLIKLRYLIGTQTRDLPASSIASQPSALPRIPLYFVK
jgi:hypothetical protein